MKNIRTGSEAASRLGAYFKDSDQAFIQKTFKSLKSFPQMTQLNRGFSFAVEGQKFTVTVKNIFKNEYELNGKTSWIYSPTNSIQIQTENLAQRLERDQRSAFNFIFPEAHAIGPIPLLLIGALISITLGGVSERVAAYLQPHVDQWNCANADPTKYVDFKQCGEYLKFMDSQRKGIPNAVASDKARMQIPLIVKPPKCYTKDSPTFEQDFENLEKRITVRRTIKYDDTGKPIEMIERQISPVDPARKLTYKLNEKGQLLEVYAVDKLLATRDPQKAELVTKDGLEFLAPFDAVLENVVANLKLCDTEVQDRLERAADQSASGPVSVLTSDEASVPSPGDSGTKTAK